MTSNIAQSVRDKLVQIARTQNKDFNHILSRYAIERIMYRLSKSQYADRFVLKGAMLFTLWFGQSTRPTKDLDLLGYGKFDFESLRKIFQDICKLPVTDDGLIFDDLDIEIHEIREGELYHGLQTAICGKLGSARITVTIDVGIGDSVLPAPKLEKYPTLIDLPAPEIRVYPPETVIAEKFDAIVVLGMRNSRMKDYYDIWNLIGRLEFDGAVLSEAIIATFRQRGHQLPYIIPTGIKEEFAANPDKTTQWKGFLRRMGLSQDKNNFANVVLEINNFFAPLISAWADKATFNKKWHPFEKWH